jgi:WD40 repeat protein
MIKGGGMHRRSSVLPRYIWTCVGLLCMVPWTLGWGRALWGNDENGALPPRQSLCEKSAKCHVFSAFLAFSVTSRTGSQDNASSEPPPRGALLRLGTLQMRSPGISTLEFVANGKGVLVGDWEGVISIWDLSRGKKQQCVKTGPGWILGVSPNRSIALVEQETGEVGLSDLSTGKELARFKTSVGPAKCAVFSKEGELAAVPSGERAVAIIDVTKRKECVRFSVPGKGVIAALAWSPVESTLAIALEHRQRGVGLVWVGSPWGQTKAYSLSVEGATCLEFTAAGRELAVGTRQGPIQVWDTRRGKRVQVIEGHDQGTTVMRCSPDGKLLATGGRDGVVRLWSIEQGKVLRKLGKCRYKVAYLSFSPDGRTLASGYDSGVIRIWEVLTGQERMESEGHESGVLCAAVSADGNTIATGGDDGIVRIWSKGRAKSTVAYKEHEVSVRSVCLSRGGKLAGSCDRKAVHLWQAETGRREWTIEAKEQIETVIFSPDDRILVVSEKGRIYLWSIEGRKLITELGAGQGTSGIMAFSPDGKLLAQAGEKGEVILWDVERKGERRVRGARGEVNCLRFCSGGAMLVGTCSQGGVYVWKVEDGTVVCRSVWQGRVNRAASCLAISPDGKRLAAANGRRSLTVGERMGEEEHIVQIVDVQTGKEIGVLKGHGGKVNSLTYSASGDILISVSEDTTGLLWEMKRN